MMARVVRFSKREREIMHAIGRELSYREIGLELHLSEHTVRAHVRTIALKIDEFAELPPRWRILALVRYTDWEQRHAATLPKTA